MTRAISVFPMSCMGNNKQQMHNSCMKLWGTTAVEFVQQTTHRHIKSFSVLFFHVQGRLHIVDIVRRPVSRKLIGGFRGRWALAYRVARVARGGLSPSHERNMNDPSWNIWPHDVLEMLSDLYATCREHEGAAKWFISQTGPFKALNTNTHGLHTLLRQPQKTVFLLLITERSEL